MVLPDGIAGSDRPAAGRTFSGKQGLPVLCCMLWWGLRMCYSPVLPFYVFFLLYIFLNILGRLTARVVCMAGSIMLGAPTVLAGYGRPTLNPNSRDTHSHSSQ